MPTSRLWKYVTIVSFCQSAKQPLTPLEQFKCLDHGWKHAQDCAHKHTDGCSEARFIFIFVNEVTIVDYQSWLAMHVYFVDG